MAVARHEMGHAFMAAYLDYRVGFSVYGKFPNGLGYGWTAYQKPSLVDSAKILNAGMLALYVNSVSGKPELASFIDWFSDDSNLAISGISDWNQILTEQGKPLDEGLAFTIKHAILPYFEDVAGVLAGNRSKLDSLTNLAVKHPGIGRHMFYRLYHGGQPNRWDIIRDWHAVSQATKKEKRRFLGL